MEAHDLTVVMRFIPRTDFSHNLLKALDQQRKNADNVCDVLLKAAGQSFHAHRAVLSAQSRYFRIMFGSGFQESGCFTIDLTPAVDDSSILEQILDYMYSGQIEVTNHSCVDLLKMADFLLLDSLKTECAQYLATNLGPQNCIFIWECANCFHFPMIAQLCQAVLDARFHDFIESGEELVQMRQDNL